MESKNDDWAPPSERKILMNKADLMSVQDKLPFPPKLTQMIQNKKWVHPGDKILEEKIPFIDCTLDFLQTKEKMLINSWGILMEDEAEKETFSAYRGSFATKRDLPWIDVEKSIAIIINRELGDDHVISLDFRRSLNNPRVVGSEWISNPTRMIYREISPTFSDFLKLLGM